MLHAPKAQQPIHRPVGVGSSMPKDAFPASARCFMPPCQFQGREGTGTFYYANGAYYHGEIPAWFRAAHMHRSILSTEVSRSGRATSRRAMADTPLMMEKSMMGQCLVGVPCQTSSSL